MPQPPSITRVLEDKTRDRFASLLTLARWRTRQTGWLLLAICLGFVAAMTIACFVPLFTTVARVSSLQALFQANPTSNTVTLGVDTQGLSSSMLNSVQQQVLPLVQPGLSSYLQGDATMAVQAGGIQGLSPASLQHAGYFTIYATPLATLKPSLRLIAGRWPTNNPHTLEMVLTPQTAQALHLSTGESITLQGGFSTLLHNNGQLDPRTALTIQLVGLFEVKAPAPSTLQGQTFQPLPSSPAPTYPLLTDSTFFLQSLDQMATRLHTSAIFAVQPFQLTWSYVLHTANLSSDQVPDLTNRLITTRTNVSNYASKVQTDGDVMSSAPITQMSLYGPAPGSLLLLDLLQQYTNLMALVSIPITVLALQIIALLLFFVSVLVGVLLDRQMAANALLSSRGASGRQIFWSLFLQGVALCLPGIVLGPLAGITLTSTLVTGALPAGSSQLAQRSLAQPLTVLSNIGPGAGGTLLVTLLAIGLIVRSTSKLNILTLRQEASRVTRAPFWQRYYFDLLAAVIALSAYGVSLYLANIAHQVDITTQELILAPLTLVAPIFLLLGCLLLALRLFPWLLHFGSWVANRRRGATSMLALVQMARAPRRTMRMTLLLALTIAFALFAQVFSATQTQHSNDVATYEAGADFSGDFANPPDAQALSLNQVIERYRHVPGVLAASADYTDQGSIVDSTGATATIQFRAIDPQSFLQTIIWPAQDLSQPGQSLPALLQRLSVAKQTALPDGTIGWVVPVLIDQSLATQMQLSAGSLFAASLNGFNPATFHYQVAAIVAHIPTINASPVASSSQPSGGIIASYPTFRATYGKIEQEQLMVEGQSVASDFEPPLPPNHVWLRTSDNAATLASVRSQLSKSSSPLTLSHLYDRREIAAELQRDPFHLTILLLLEVGAFIAFLLALIGNLVASWLSVRDRRGSFVVLRALGAASHHIATILLWEQGIVYTGALVLGLAFGSVLTSVAVPVLITTGLPAQGPMSNLSISDLYLLQQALPLHIVVSPSLFLLLFALLCICLIALAVMVYAALRPTISSELRLNDD